MIIKIELNPADCQIIERSVNDGKGGQRQIYEQQAYLHVGKAHPVPFRISIRNPSMAYSSGEYTLDPSSFRVNQYNTLELNRFEIRLVPLAKPAARATA